MSNWHKTEQEILAEQAMIEKSKENPAAFAPIYNKYHRSIYLFIFKRVGNEDLTADLTSQVFLKALLHLPKYIYKGLPFSAWLFRIAVNEVNLHFRNSRNDRAIFIDDAGLERLKNGLAEENEEFDNTHEEAVINGLNYLNEEEVQFIELRFFEDKSFKEIGYIFNITENNAKVRTYRILDKIRKKIGEHR